ncbi:asparaginase [soil metagenome]
MSAAPLVTLLSLGGTIAAPVDERGGGATITLTADDIVRDLAARAGVTVEARTFRQLPSASPGFADIVELAAAIDAAHESAGVVVTLGTDSLEEVAYALDLLLHRDAPVVVTCAMRNAGAPGADGAANLLASLRVASSATARGLGVVVVANDEIHLARYVSKTNSSSPSTFDSRNVGRVGWVTEGKVRVPLARRHRPPRLAAGEAVPAVGLVRVSLDDDPAVLLAVAGTGLSGLVVEAFGGGHVNARAVEALAAIATTIPVVYVSRTGEGDVYQSTGAFPGSERDLLEASLIPGGAFDGLKARVLLALLLAAGASRVEIAERFAESD